MYWRLVSEWMNDELASLRRRRRRRRRRRNLIHTYNRRWSSDLAVLCFALLATGNISLSRPSIYLSIYLDLCLIIPEDRLCVHITCVARDSSLAICKSAAVLRKAGVTHMHVPTTYS
jgi:hypothetical protein